MYLLQILVEIILIKSVILSKQLLTRSKSPHVVIYNSNCRMSTLGVVDRQPCIINLDSEAVQEDYSL
jgi:hypothetical protein